MHEKWIFYPNVYLLLEILQWTFYFPCFMFIMVTGEIFSIKVMKGFCRQVDCSGGYLLLANFNDHILLVSKVILLEVSTRLKQKPQVLNINAAKVGTIFPWILCSSPVLVVRWKSNRSADQNTSSRIWRLWTLHVQHSGLGHGSRSPWRRAWLSSFKCENP